MGLALTAFMYVLSMLPLALFSVTMSLYAAFTEIQKFQIRKAVLAVMLATAGLNVPFFIICRRPLLFSFAAVYRLSGLAPNSDLF